MNNLALVLQARGKLDEAEPLYMPGPGGPAPRRGPEHPDTLTSMNNLAIVLQGRGKLEEAEPLFRKALATNAASSPPGTPTR